MALVKHDVPFAMVDAISPLMENIFDDSKIANSYAAAKTKLTCIVIKVMANVSFMIPDICNDN